VLAGAVGFAALQHVDPPRSPAAAPPSEATSVPAIVKVPLPIPDGALAQWSAYLDERPWLAKERFHVLLMTSGIGLGGADQADTAYRDYLSRTMRIGIAVPILYMRTTHGRQGDWRFDPDFDLARKCGDRAVAEDNLASVIRYSIAHGLPVQFILNGGIWADASCESPQWDLTDHLQEDRANCQWSQHDEVFPDDYLRGLTGSTESPLLARSLTYHAYAGEVRRYKRRNLQAAARIIAAFAREHQDLFVGAVLDADTYMNPFFEGKAVFDYNPGMLRQFREWLRGAGAYARRPPAGSPNFFAHRRRYPLTLAEVNSLARQNWRRWSDVEPPRRLPGLSDPLTPDELPIWKDPWWNVWDEFRKHIVDLHYDDLSTWAHEAGLPRERIFSAQGLVQDGPARMPFAVRVDSASRSYDSGGVSIEGAIPENGHLGAIVYGHTARNDLEMENGHSLFATIGRMDEGWAIVEYNNTDLTAPTVPPDYAMAYKTFRDAFNYGAQEVSAMAWNGSNGIYIGKPGYAPHTSWRNTAAEDAMLDFMVSHADLPHGARLWTFGTPRRPDTDGWTADRGDLAAGAGFATLLPQGTEMTLLSPPDQVIRPAEIDRLVLRFSGTTPVRTKAFARRDAVSDWVQVADAPGTDIALRWPAPWHDDPRAIVEQIRIEISFPAGTRDAKLARVLLYPATASRALP